ncbi:MAG: hypothetical protein QOE90_1475 [Thermoplasmata archaeon]|jgi:hypothetical protein|nr:hypothetical protein [Thermoplasmata archaeon]
MRFVEGARRELARAWPYALVLALGLGAVVVVGANISNAFPSKDRPFGWPGPASFENAVAMVRPDIVLATTLPALLLGATALRERDAGFLPILAVDASLLLVASFLASFVGLHGSSGGYADAFVAFACATALLAGAFWALALLLGSLLRRHAVPASLVLWVGFVSIYENATRTALFRQVGYDGLTAGQFPAWFWVSQALSPLTAYRGVLILWRGGFMDYLEKAALAGADMPAWMSPLTFAGVLALWIALPVAAAGAVLWIRRRPAAAGASAGIGPRTPSEMQP